MGEHEVIAPKETSLVVPLAQHYHLVSLGKDGSVPFLLDSAPRVRLSTIRQYGNQPQPGQSGFQRKHRFSRQHIEAESHTTIVVSDAHSIERPDLCLDSILQGVLLLDWDASVTGKRNRPVFVQYIFLHSLIDICCTCVRGRNRPERLPGTCFSFPSVRQFSLPVRGIFFALQGRWRHQAKPAAENTLVKRSLRRKIFRRMSSPHAWFCGCKQNRQLCKTISEEERQRA